MNNSSKIGFINNSEGNFILNNLNYININKKISIKELNKLNSFEDFDYIFLYENDILYLKDLSSNLPSIYVDFINGSVDFRRKTSGIKQDILKAIGINNNKNIKILDATAGLCKDSFIFATYNLNVTALEKNSLIYNITLDALNRARNNENTNKIIKNINFINIDSIDYMKNNDCDFDCIYLDPMFPKKNKTSLCKKEMQIFHNLAYYGDNNELFNLAFSKTKNRIVVKRMLKSEYIVDKKPSYQIFGKVIRYDIYLK